MNSTLAEIAPLANRETAWSILFRSGALGDFILTLPLLRRLCGQGRPVCLVTRRAYRCLVPPDCAVACHVDADCASLAWLFADSAAPPPAPLADLLPGASVHTFMTPDPVFAANLRRAGCRRVRWIESRPSAPPHAAARFLIDAGFRPPPGLLRTPPALALAMSAPRAVASRAAGLWLHPGSGSPAKNWPPLFFARFAAAWQAAHPGMSVHVSYGDADMPLLASCRAAFAHCGVNGREWIQPALPELVAALHGLAAFFVGNDSGVTHVAAALGIPTVALFRATSPRIWRPLGRVAVIEPPAADHGTARLQRFGEDARGRACIVQMLD